jgi:hypothetical protein
VIELNGLITQIASEQKETARRLDRVLEAGYHSASVLMVSQPSRKAAFFNKIQPISVGV